MAFPTFNPPVRQSKGTTISPTIKILSAEFGDGYTQESPDGINHIRDSVDLVWDTLLPEDAIAIETFLRGQKGTNPFWYDVDELDHRKWTCKVWKRTRDEVHSFSATFVESFLPE